MFPKILRTLFGNENTQGEFSYTILAIKEVLSIDENVHNRPWNKCYSGSLEGEWRESGGEGVGEVRGWGDLVDWLCVCVRSPVLVVTQAPGGGSLTPHFLFL